MPRGVYERNAPVADPDEIADDTPTASMDDDGMPSREELMARLAEVEALLAQPPTFDSTDDIPDGLIVPIQTTPTIDLSKPEDCPDLPDDEWSRQHMLQFLARQPRSMVFIEKEGWEAKGVDTYQYVGYQGHGFRVLKGKPVTVPIQIAAIIEQSQEEFPTAQSQAKKRALTNIADLPPVPGSLGVPGLETFLER